MSTKLIEPNYTQIPNLILDNMGQLSDAELRVLLFLCRQTFGWHRENTKKASTAFIAKSTGMSDQGVINGVKRMIEKGIVERSPSGNSFTYSIVVAELEPSNGVGDSDLPPINGVGTQQQKTTNGVDTQTVKTINGVGTNKERGERKGNKETGVSEPEPCEEVPPTTPQPAIEQQAEQVYAAYPRKVGKPKALASIAKQIKKHSFDHVLKLTVQFGGLWRDEKDLTYCPHPTTWFNQERFNDSPSDWNKPKGANSYAGQNKAEPLSGSAIDVTPEEESESKKQHDLLVRLWREAFKNKYGIPYMLDVEGKDYDAVDELLSAGWLPDKVVAQAKKAWDITPGCNREERCWACLKYSKTIRDFLKFSSQIVTQLDCEGHRKPF